MKSPEETHRIQFDGIFKSLWYALKTYEPIKDMITVYWRGLRGYPIVTIRMAAGNLKTGPEFPTLNQWQSVCNMAVTPPQKVEEPPVELSDYGKEFQKLMFAYLRCKITGDVFYNGVKALCEKHHRPFDPEYETYKGKEFFVKRMPSVNERREQRRALRRGLEEDRRLLAEEEVAVKRITGGDANKE